MTLEGEAIGFPVRDDASQFVSAEDCVEAVKRLSPMKRLFTIQQLHAMARGEDTIFDGLTSPEDAIAIFDDWLTGFSPDVIEAFESGKWEVPI